MQDGMARLPALLSKFSFLVIQSVIFLGPVVANEGLPTVLSNPVPLNVSVGDTAVFTCNVTYLNNLHVFWYINGTSIQTINEISDEANLDINVDPAVASVEIKVQDKSIPLLNNSNITCEAYRDGFGTSSEPGILMIQGKLDAPKNLSAKFLGSDIVITWISPYKIDGINIIEYEVNISIVGHPIKEDYYNTTNENNFSFDKVDNSSCTLYQICVQAVTLAGLGEPSCMNKSRIGVPQSLTEEEVSISISFAEDFITAIYEYQEDDCVGTQADSASVEFEYGLDSAMTNIPLHRAGQGTVKFKVFLPPPFQGLHTNTLINLTNSAGSTQSDPIPTSFFSIQDVTTTNDTFGTNVTCIFASNSTSLGCRIILKCNLNFSSVNQVENCTMDLKREDSSTLSVTTAIDGCENDCPTFTLYAYDISNNGTIGSTPAKIQNNITIIHHHHSASHPMPTTETPAVTPEANDSDPWMIIAIVLIVFIVLIGIITSLVVIIWCIYKKKTKDRKNDRDLSKNDVALA